MEFLTGAIVGFVVAGLIGRAKFLQVQNKLRDAARTMSEQAVYLRDQAVKYQQALITERNLNAGLVDTLDDVSQRTRITGV